MKRLLLAVGALIALAGGACTLTSCLPRETHRVEAPPFTITYALKEKRRSDRTTFEYTYEGWVATSGSPKTGVKAEVRSSNPDTEITDRFLMFPGAENVNATPSFDTFTIRQNRNAPFNPADLVWSVSGMSLPPDPGEAGKVTLEGIDSNSDGVRDDIERYIELSFPQSETMREASFDVVRVVARALADAGDKASSLLHADAFGKAYVCANWAAESMAGFEDGYFPLRRTQAEFVNTRARNDAYLQFHADIAWTTSKPVSDPASSNCTFDPMSMEN